MWLLWTLACSTPSGETGDTAWDRGDNPHPLDDVLTLSHVQALGTHNSYHVEPEYPADDSHRYTHEPLGVQLAELGVRQLELDVHLHEDEGWVVFHLPGIDEESTCRAFSTCLEEMKDFSDANGWHLPLVVWIEPKDEAMDALFDELLPITGHFDELEQAILEVWPRERLFTPDDLRGEHPDLPTALATDGWPTLDELRGRVLFALLDTGDHRDEYLAGSDVLEGRLLFADGTPDDPWTALIKDGSSEEITTWVEAGFVVTDNIDSADGSDADNAARLAEGLAAGTQFLASDLPGVVEGHDYQAAIPGGQPAGCNPITAPGDCTAAAVEDLD